MYLYRNTLSFYMTKLIKSADDFFICDFVSIVAGNGKRFGNILWTNRLCKTVSHAWSTHAKSYAFSHTYVHPIALLWSFTEHIFRGLK